MKTFLLLFLSLFLFAQTQVRSQNVNPDSLDVFVSKMMTDFDIPGMAIGIISNDSVIIAKGYGTREIHKDLPVNEHTLFGIGSISKSITALSLAILVDEGKISWDDHVKDYLPYFELYDPYVTEHFTIRDLLTHRSGLQPTSGGSLWYHSDFSRKEVIERLKYLEPVSEFRTTPAYQNVMYVVAGEIVGAVSGMPWDDFVKNRIFNPLRMEQSTSVAREREANTNLAQPHVENENYEPEAVEQEKGDNLASAGFVYSSAEEMIQYIRLLLNNGLHQGDTLVSPAILSELFKPQIIYPLFGPPFHNEFTSYGFGWWLTMKNGHKLIEHSGGIDGMSANVIMIKDLNLGFVVLCNTDGFGAFLASFYLLEHILDDPTYNLYEYFKAMSAQNIQREQEALKRQDSLRIKNTQPSKMLKDYTGIYRDKMYGDLNINQAEDGALEIKFSHTPLFSARLNHWQNDTFMIDWYDIRMPNGFLTFTISPEQKITGFELNQENLLDVNFNELKFEKVDE